MLALNLSYLRICLIHRLTAFVFAENRPKKRVDLLDQPSRRFLMLQNHRQIALDDLQKRSHRRRVDSTHQSNPAFPLQHQRSHLQAPVFFLVEPQQLRQLANHEGGAASAHLNDLLRVLIASGQNSLENHSQRNHRFIGEPHDRFDDAIHAVVDGMRAEARAHEVSPRALDGVRVVVVLKQHNEENEIVEVPLSAVPNQFAAVRQIDAIQTGFIANQEVIQMAAQVGESQFGIGQRLQAQIHLVEELNAQIERFDSLGELNVGVMRENGDFIEQHDRLSDLFSTHVESVEREEILVQEELLELLVVQLDEKVFAVRRYQPVEEIEHRRLRREIAELLEKRHCRRRVDGFFYDSARRSDERRTRRLLVVQLAQLRAGESIRASRQMDVRPSLQKHFDGARRVLRQQNLLDSTNERVHLRSVRLSEQQLQLLDREGHFVLRGVRRSHEELRLHEELLAGVQEGSALLLEGLADLLELLVIRALRDVEALDQLENHFRDAATLAGAQHAHLEGGAGQLGDHALVDEGERLAVQREELTMSGASERHVEAKPEDVLQLAD